MVGSGCPLEEAGVIRALLLRRRWRVARWSGRRQRQRGTTQRSCGWFDDVTRGTSALARTGKRAGPYHGRSQHSRHFRSNQCVARFVRRCLLRPRHLLPPYSGRCSSLCAVSRVHSSPSEELSVTASECSSLAACVVSFWPSAARHSHDPACTRASSLPCHCSASATRLPLAFPSLLLDVSASRRASS